MIKNDYKPTWYIEHGQWLCKTSMVSRDSGLIYQFCEIVFEPNFKTVISRVQHLAKIRNSEIIEFKFTKK